MDRRTLLRALLAGGAATLVSGCARDRDVGQAPASSAPTTAAQPGVDAVQQVAPEAVVDLQVINASFETLTGEQQPFAFGLTDASNEPVADADVSVYVLIPGRQPTVVGNVEYHDLEALPLAVYVVHLDLPEPGTADLVVVTTDGRRAGATQLVVATPESSAVAAPGQDAKAVPTATEDNLRGVAELCTADPPCGMHEVSLEQAIEDARPVMLTFATPAYCQTAVCGPSVQTIDQVRADGEWGDVAWIHVEIFSDAGETLTDAVKEWNLPSEPWLFSIGADGTVAARRDGPLLVIPEEIETVAHQL